jgi:microcystin degradation protein MlrC
VKRILVSECKQEISSFNPLLGQYEDFTVHRGAQIFSLHRNMRSEMAGALAAFAAYPSIEVVPGLSVRGITSVLKSANFVLVVTSRAVSLYDRSLFLAHGQDPARFDAVIVKSPHCRPQFFDQGAELVLNVDAPGSASANLQSLGHRVCKRPIFPLDPNVPWTPEPQIFGG